MNDVVNNPKHYTYSGIEPIDVIDAWELDFYLGNVLKYLSRHKHKENPLQDIKKARFYLDRKIMLMEKEEKK